MKKWIAAVLMAILMLTACTAFAETMIEIKVVKKLVGIAPEDLPDGTKFELRFYDMDGDSLTGKLPSSLVFTKEELVAGKAGGVEKPIRIPVKPGVKIAVTENSTKNVNGYDASVKMECSTGLIPGEPPRDPDDGSTPVGSFEIDTVPLAPGTDVNLPNLMRSGASVHEIVITNVFVPIKVEQMPKTGDESSLALWAGMMLASVGAYLMIQRRKHTA